MGIPQTYAEALEVIVKVLETDDKEDRQKLLEDLKRGIQDLKREEKSPFPK